MGAPGIEVQDTAFMTCCFRSSNEALSGDRYAKLWASEAAWRWVPTYVAEVSPFEPVAHCLRNRFFLDRIGEFFARHPGAVLVNIGAGFSFYPFLLPSGHRTFEADLPSVVERKTRRIEDWMNAGDLPRRDVTFAAVDLESPESCRALEVRLREWIAGAPTFALLEGVLFFLRRDAVDRVFEALTGLQREGDRLGAVSFVPEVRETVAYRRLLSFFARRLDQSRRDYTALAPAFYDSLGGFERIEHTDYRELSRRYLADEKSGPDPEWDLNEHLWIVERRFERG